LVGHVSKIWERKDLKNIDGPLLLKVNIWNTETGQHNTGNRLK